MRSQTGIRGDELGDYHGAPARHQRHASADEHFRKRARQDQAPEALSCVHAEHSRGTRKVGCNAARAIDGIDDDDEEYRKTDQKRLARETEAEPYDG